MLRTALARSARNALSIGLIAASTWAAAAEVEVEGYKFQDTATLHNQVLQLNGAATSSILSTRSTAVAFYLPRKQTTMEAAVAEKGAKRITFYMMRDVSSRDLANAMLDRIRQNAADEFAKNIIQTSQLGVVFGNRAKLLKGDLVTIDYDPAKQTTEFNVNGQKVGDTIQGESFFPMMMKVWIGPKVRGSTRDGLLGIAPAK